MVFHTLAGAGGQWAHRRQSLGTSHPPPTPHSTPCQLAPPSLICKQKLWVHFTRVAAVQLPSCLSVWVPPAELQDKLWTGNGSACEQIFAAVWQVGKLFQYWVTPDWDSVWWFQSCLKLWCFQSWLRLCVMISLLTESPCDDFSTDWESVWWFQSWLRICMRYILYLSVLGISGTEATNPGQLHTDCSSLCSTGWQKHNLGLDL